MSTYSNTEICLEKGFAKLANPMMEALYQTRIPGEEAKLFWFIFRKTVGFNKELGDVIPLSQFVKGTGIVKQRAHRLLQKLSLKNIIFINRQTMGGCFYAVNFNFEQWRQSPKKGTSPKQVTAVTHKGDAWSPKRVTSTDMIQTKGSTDISLKDNSDESVNRLIQYAARTCSLTILGKNEDVLKQLLDRHPYERISEAMGHFALYQLESEEGRRFLIGKTFDAFVRKFDLFVDADSVDRRLEAERRWHNEHRGNRNNLDPWKKQENPESYRETPEAAEDPEEKRQERIRFLGDYTGNIETVAEEKGLDVSEMIRTYPTGAQRYRDFKEELNELLKEPYKIQGGEQGLAAAPASLVLGGAC
jgi:phage replication O-like protein O